MWGELSWGEFSLGRVVLGRVVFGASCPDPTTSTMIIVLKTNPTKPGYDSRLQFIRALYLTVDFAIKRVFVNVFDNFHIF